MSRQSDLEQLCAAAREQGWRVEGGGHGHMRFVPPGQGQIVVCSISPRNPTSERANTIARMRRSGFVWPPGSAPRHEVQPKQPPQAPPLRKETIAEDIQTICARPTRVDRVKAELRRLDLTRSGEDVDKGIAVALKAGAIVETHGSYAIPQRRWRR